MLPLTRQCGTRTAPLGAAGRAVASVTFTSGSFSITRCEHSAWSLARAGAAATTAAMTGIARWNFMRPIIRRTQAPSPRPLLRGSERHRTIDHLLRRPSGRAQFPDPAVAVRLTELLPGRLHDQRVVEKP